VRTEAAFRYSLYTLDCSLTGKSAKFLYFYVIR